MKLPTSICDYCLENICLADNIRKLSMKSDNYLKALYAIECGSDYPSEKTETVLVQKPIFQNLFIDDSRSIKDEPGDILNDNLQEIDDNQSSADDDDFQTFDYSKPYNPLPTIPPKPVKSITPLPEPSLPPIKKVRRKKGEKVKKEFKNLYPCTFCGMEFKIIQHCVRHEMVSIII